MSPEPKTRQTTHHLWLALIVAFLLRASLPLLVWIATHDPEAYHFPDTRGYIRSAKQLISPSLASPEIDRPPGYQVLLIPGILAGKVELVTLVLQVFISCFAVYMIFRLALLLFENFQIAFGCAYLYAIEPLSILFSSVLLSETLFTTMFLIFLYYFIRFLRQGALKHLLFSAVVLAASAYVRPVTYYLPALVTAGLWLWVIVKMRNRKILILQAGLFLLIAMGLTGVWQVRNKKRGDYSGFAPVSEKNMYFYLAASVLAKEQGVSFREMRERMGCYDREVYFQNHPEQRSWSQGKQLHFMGKEAKRILLENFSSYLGIHLKGMIQFMLDPGAVYYLKVFKVYPKSGGLMSTILQKGLIQTVVFLFRENPLLFWTNLVLGLLLGAYLLAAAVALGHSRVLFNIEGLALVAFACYFWALAGGPLALSRLRHPVMPILCLFAGYSLVTLYRRIGSGATRGRAGVRTGSKNGSQALE